MEETVKRLKAIYKLIEECLAQNTKKQKTQPKLGKN